MWHKRKKKENKDQIREAGSLYLLLRQKKRETANACRMLLICLLSIASNHMMHASRLEESVPRT